MPVQEHLRHDLYSLTSVNAFRTETPSGDKSHEFGQVSVPSAHVVFSSPLSLVIVNRKPVLPGHLLALPRRRVPLLQELTIQERSDLFEAANRAALLTMKFNGCSANTISIQVRYSRISI
jgi:bis(5'-adenosyl)-triphosphatase